jgi:hypothetical protein
MMGSQDDHQDQFFYHFRLADHVPEDHLLRRIDAALDAPAFFAYSDNVRRMLKPTSSWMSKRHRHTAPPK